jgi:hypothetical protein
VSILQIGDRVHEHEAKPIVMTKGDKDSSKFKVSSKMPVAESLTALRLGFELVDPASNVSGRLTKSSYEKLVTKDRDTGRVYNRIKELMEERKVLCDDNAYSSLNIGVDNNIQFRRFVVHIV